MEEHSRDHLRVLGQLAREYERKLQELHEALRSVPPEMAPRMLRLRGEMTTDHFRTAQVRLLQLLAQETPSQAEDARNAAATLFRSFDEMRILFEISLERSSSSEG